MVCSDDRREPAGERCTTPEESDIERGSSWTRLGAVRGLGERFKVIIGGSWIGSKRRRRRTRVKEIYWKERRKLVLSKCSRRRVKSSLEDFCRSHGGGGTKRDGYCTIQHQKKDDSVHQ